MTTAAPASRLRAFYDAFFVAFCSLRLTVAILLILGAGCVVGMFVDQTRTFEEHAQAWAAQPWKYHTFTTLEFHDVFHSWWFSAFIVLLALNLIACSLDRLPRIWLDIHNPDPILGDAKLRGIKHVAHYTAQDAGAVKDAFLAALGKTAPPRSNPGADGATHVFAEKHRYARTGVYVVHVALLFIMGGSVATTTLGFDGTIGIVEGTAGRFAFGKGPSGLRYRKDLGFTVKCTDFRLKQFVDGAPMDYESDLVVTDDRGRERARKTIQVNDPLEFGGFTLYQASFQPVAGDERVKLAIGRPGQPKTEYDVTPGTAIAVPGSASKFIPLEVIGNYATLGPALRVQQVDQGKPPTSFLVFQNYPDFDGRARRGDFALHYKGADKTYMTGIQVASFPGVDVVFGGFLMMFVGMYMAFFMSHRRYWLRLTPAGNGRVDVVLAGAARRHQYAFEEQFDELAAALEQVPGVRRTDRAPAAPIQHAAAPGAESA